MKLYRFVKPALGCVTLLTVPLYPQAGARNIDGELQRQDTYLEHFHRNRSPVLPDGNSLFASIQVSGRLPQDADELRRATVEYIAGNLNDFNQFMSPDPSRSMLDSMRDIAEQLDTMKRNGTWIGYETVMALSRYLKAVIVITSGGAPGNDAVRTDSFYYGEEWPEKEIHITWVSAGFYHAVLPVSDAEPKLGTDAEPKLSSDYDNVYDKINCNNDSGYFQKCIQDSQRSCGGYESIGQMYRQPCHICQCKRMCDCKRWSKMYTFPVDVAKTSTESSPPKAKSADFDWSEVFMHLSKDAHVLRRWKFVMRWLKLSEASFVEIEDKREGISDKVHRAFDLWRNEQGSGATIAALQGALRKERLNLAAGKIPTSQPTCPLHPLRDIRLRHCSSTGSCPSLRPAPRPTRTSSRLATPLLSSAMLSLVVLASFFRVVSILEQLWVYCLYAFGGRVRAM